VNALTSASEIKYFNSCFNQHNAVVFEYHFACTRKLTSSFERRVVQHTPHMPHQWEQCNINWECTMGELSSWGRPQRWCV